VVHLIAHLHGIALNRYVDAARTLRHCSPKL
jgi:hypothetical protein